MAVKTNETRVLEIEHGYVGESPIRTLLYLFEEQKLRVLVAFIFF